VVRAKGSDMAKDKLPGQEIVKQDAPAGAVQRKRYSPPLLTKYGHISKLTMGGAGTGTDGGMVGMRMSCL
jgi:hypothetical protein